MSYQWKSNYLVCGLCRGGDTHTRTRTHARTEREREREREISLKHPIIDDNY